MDSQPEFIRRIQKAYTTETLYSEELFEQYYEDAVLYCENKEEAIDFFNRFVSQVNADCLAR